jgi:hypothetical protein
VVLTVWKLLLVYSCAPLANEDTEIDYHIWNFFLLAVNAIKVKSVLQYVFCQVCFEVWVLLLWRILDDVNRIIWLDWLSEVRRLRGFCWLDVGLDDVFSLTWRKRACLLNLGLRLMLNDCLDFFLVLGCHWACRHMILFVDVNYYGLLIFLRSGLLW